MIIQEALRLGIARLSRASDHRDSAALDAEILLSSALGVEREKLYIHSGDPMPKRALATYHRYLARRGRHEPVAYILGEKEFFGLRFTVNRNVLILRPETETLVEEVIRKVGKKKVTIIDVGTGSGAIAVALAKNLPNARIVATDISSKALTIARANARRHGVSNRIRFVRANLLPKLLHAARSTLHADIVVANLPYLPTAVWKKTTPEIRRYEPRTALDGGRDGLDLYRKLLDQMTHLRWSSAFFEIDPHQVRSMSALIRNFFPATTIAPVPDLQERKRFLVVRSKNRGQ
ncbi:protein-(glutamine-N5) methyltransferase, release factor-specific [Candidatus Uhrbacteria bacterium RIFCSPHIGHO2_02_FULL_57_19]|uniref:Release factor glutamine methyltransferase n=1 Tax=Candidatus Uhrbacteria bacterium RIFCSPHIGHO2_02_FULL_57_19 TaxID=1802391 RepID=A0A1F7U6B4_9BACT|nr:MAG: protein-(glutamine-N5) methyltransferase, release factor-specific [Candidatus Uhrbacteria bacterium RIFCSPHIGHO2_02_FULL_57_19]